MSYSIKIEESPTFFAYYRNPELEKLPIKKRVEIGLILLKKTIDQVYDR